MALTSHSVTCRPSFIARAFKVVYGSLLEGTEFLEGAERKYEKQNLPPDELRSLFNLLAESRELAADFFLADGELLPPPKPDSELSEMLRLWSRHKLNGSGDVAAKKAPGLSNLAGPNLWLKFVSPGMDLRREADQRFLALELLEETPILTDVVAPVSIGPVPVLLRVLQSLDPSPKFWKVKTDSAGEGISFDPSGGTITVCEEDVTRAEKALADLEGLQAEKSSLGALAGAMRLPYPGDHVAVILSKP